MPKKPNPFDRIVESYKDYKYANDKLLENYQPNNDYSLEYLQTRNERVEAAIAAIEYAKTYVESESDTVPDPPWTKED
jgi:hypothetical protein